MVLVTVIIRSGPHHRGSVRGDPAAVVADCIRGRSTSHPGPCMDSATVGYRLLAQFAQIKRGIK